MTRHRVRPDLHRGDLSDLQGAARRPPSGRASGGPVVALAAARRSWIFIGPLFGGARSARQSPSIWLFVLVGTVIGVIVGALAGRRRDDDLSACSCRSPSSSTPSSAIALLLSISVGNRFGNSIPAILMGMPGLALGDPDGGRRPHAAQKGQSGLALAVALVAAMGGQAISIVLFVLMVVPLMQLAYYFRPAGAVRAVPARHHRHRQPDRRQHRQGPHRGGDRLPHRDRRARPGHADAALRRSASHIVRSGIDLAPVVIGLLSLSELFRSRRQVFRWEIRDGDTVSNAKFPPWSKLKETIPAIIGGIVHRHLRQRHPRSRRDARRADQLSAGAALRQAAGGIRARIDRRPRRKRGGAERLQFAARRRPPWRSACRPAAAWCCCSSALTVHGFVPGPSMIRNSPELFYAAIAGMLAATVILSATGWHLGLMMLRLVNVNRSMVIVFSIAVIVLGVYCAELARVRRLCRARLRRHRLLHVALRLFDARPPRSPSCSAASSSEACASASISPTAALSSSSAGRSPGMFIALTIILFAIGVYRQVQDAAATASAARRKVERGRCALTEFA